MNSTPINLFFDASVLGIAQFDAAARTGVYRAVDALLSQFIRSENLNLKITATEGLEVKSHLLRHFEAFGIDDPSLMPRRTKLARSYGRLESLRASLGEDPTFFNRA